MTCVARLNLRPGAARGRVGAVADLNMCIPVTVFAVLGGALASCEGPRACGGIWQGHEGAAAHLRRYACCVH